MADRDPAWHVLPKPSHPHDSAPLHVTGAARYADDGPEPVDMLHLAFGQSAHAHARIRSMDLSAVRAAEGVVHVFTAADIPGANDVSPVAGDDRLLADGEVICVGQAIFLVAATSQRAARKAAAIKAAAEDSFAAQRAYNMLERLNECLWCGPL